MSESASRASAPDALRVAGSQVESPAAVEVLPAGVLSILDDVVEERSSLLVVAAAPTEAGSFVVRIGAVIVKVHAADVDEGALRQRLAVAAGLPDVFLPPSQPELTRSHGRLLTFWPLGRTVDHDSPEAVPWIRAAQLLARLHADPAPADLPSHGFPASLRDSVARMDATSDDALRAANVPGWCRQAAAAAAGQVSAEIWRGVDRYQSSRPASVVHGDFHLGQLVRWPRVGCPSAARESPSSDRGWRLIDVDALGVGEPAWDLARPAMWFLAGVVSPENWKDFLQAYVDAGGRGVRGDDPWPVLEPLARAAAVQAAASALARAGRTSVPLDDVALEFLAACGRIADL